MARDVRRLNVGKVEQVLEDADIRYRHLGLEVLHCRFRSMNIYRNQVGEPDLDVFVDLSADRLVLCVPKAWRIQDEQHRVAVLETCLRLQRTKLGLKFELDVIDDTISVALDFYSDGLPKASSIPRLIHHLVALVEDAHPHMEAAIRDGVLFGQATLKEAQILSELSELTPEQLEMLIAAIRDSESV